MDKKRVISLLMVAVGIVIGIQVFLKKISRQSRAYHALADKNFTLMLLLNQWLITKQKDKSMIEYLKKRGISSVAVYGMSYIGERLYDELKNSEIDVRYAIDREKTNICSEVKIVSLSDELEPVDAIIITPIVYFDDIYDELVKISDIPILSLEDILYEM